MKYKNNDSESRTDWEGRRDGAESRSRLPLVVGVALAISAIVAFLPEIRTMFGDDAVETASAKVEGDTKIPFGAELVVGETTDTTVSYTVAVTFVEEFMSLNYDAELVHKETGKTHSLPSGSCQSSFAEKAGNRVCTLPLHQTVEDGEYSLKMTLTDVNSNELVIEQDFLRSR